MSNETDWDELSDEYTEHTPAIIGETIRGMGYEPGLAPTTSSPAAPSPTSPAGRPTCSTRHTSRPTWTHGCGHRPNESTSARAL